MLCNDEQKQINTKKGVYLKKIIVEAYRAVGSLNTKMITFSLRTFCCCCSSLLISVSGETYKSATKRPIKIRTHHVVRKHLTPTITDKKLMNKYLRYICFFAFAVFRCLFELKTFFSELKR